MTSLLTASRVLVAVSARSLAAIEDRVTVTQFRTLVVLHSRGSSNLNSLAQELDVNASTAMRTIDRLLEAGLVSRQDNPDNRREVRLELTPEGRKVVAAVTRRRRAQIARIAQAMPDRHRQGLVEALRAFADAAGEPSPAVTALGW